MDCFCKIDMEIDYFFNYCIGKTKTNKELKEDIQYYENTEQYEICQLIKLELNRRKSIAELKEKYK